MLSRVSEKYKILTFCTYIRSINAEKNGYNMGQQKKKNGEIEEKKQCQR